MEAIKSYTLRLNAQAIGLTESNVQWNKVPAYARLHERTMGWFEALGINSAYYDKHDVGSAFQPGGVSLWSIGVGVHRTQSTGHDTSGLGRWAWTRYRGRQGIHLRVVTAYRPVLNTSGAMSVWNQQKSHFEAQDDDRCPRAIFISDILVEIRKWKEEGDQIVIGMDANEDVRTGKLSEAFREEGLIELCTDCHGMNGPTTYDRGQRPIDGIFVTSTLMASHCGYLPFEFDHRALWIDIPMSAALGHEVAEIKRPAARWLKNNDPRVRNRYLKLYEASLKELQLFERLDQLTQRISNPPSPADVKEYNNIDLLRTRAMLKAERHCRKMKMGGVPFSPDYNDTRKRIAAWTLLVKRLEGERVNSRYLRRKMHQADITDYSNITLEQALAERKEAYLENQTLKSNTARRETWLESVAGALAAEGKLTKEQCILNMRNRERQRRNARIIRRVNGKLRAGAVTSVIAPDRQGVWREVTSKKDVEDALIAENIRRFSQAQDTPFLQEPLLSAVGPVGTSMGAEEILNGTFQLPPGVDPYAAKLIPHLQRLPAVAAGRKISLTMDPEEYRKGWLKAREATASGPSRLHFGHFIANAHNKKISLFDSVMAAIPHATGLSPRRWQHGIDCELEKKAGNTRVDSLRTILLFEADANQNFKKVGRDMMYRAEELDALAQEQFGSRKTLSSVDQSLNKRLTFDLMRQLKKPGALCSNDAKSCYDRVVHSIASISMQRLGVPQEPIVSMFTTIQNLEHCIRTAYGDSAATFSGQLWAVPMHGLGQGNGAGPAIWGVVSTPVLQLLHAEGYGAFFRASISGTELSFVGYAFVDDTDLVTIPAAHASSHEVAQKMQDMLDLWEGGIRATGGAIVPEKSHWYLVNFKWKNDVWRYATTDETPAELYVRDSNGQRKKLERLSIGEAQRTLGVRLAPDGNSVREIEYLLGKAKEWRERIRTGHLPRHLVWESLQTTILKTLQYPTPATTLSKAQCDSIMSPLLQAGLPCAGISRNFPRVLVYGPTKFQGLGVTSLYTTQGLEHIERLVKFGTSMKHLTGKILRHSLEALKMELGTNGSVFSLPYETWGPLATESWLKFTWHFLAEHEMRISDGVAEFTLCREHDSLLMDNFVAAGYTGETLRTLNRCRLYLRVVMMSEVINGGGSKLRPEMLEGTKPKESSTYEWPVQGKPSAKGWKLWKTALKGLTDRGRLRQPLGRWFPGRYSGEWWYDPEHETLYQQQSATTWVYHRAPGRPSRNAVARFQHPTEIVSLPEGLHPASVTARRTYWILTGHASILEQQHQQAYSNFFEFCRSYVQPDAQWAIQHLHVNTGDNGLCLARAIENNRGVAAVSDGSFNPKALYGTAAWIIQDEHTGSELTGRMIIPGQPKDLDAYRCELGGLYGITVIIDALCKYHGITSGSITKACDGDMALKHATQEYDWISPARPHFDLIAAIWSTNARTPLKWDSKQVKGHQDDCTTATLDRWAQLNIRMDAQAKAHSRDTIGDSNRTLQQKISGEPWALWIGDRKVVRKLREEVINHVQGPPCMQYWDDKQRFAPGDSEAVDWQATAKAMKTVPHSRRIYVTKHSAGICGVGKWMQRWKKWDSAKCPRCDHEEEDAKHVLQCKGPGVEQAWEAALESFEQRCIDLNTDPTIVEGLLQRLRQWRTGTATPTEFETTPDTQQAFGNQDGIGWQAFLEGAPAKGWSDAQQRYYDALGRRNTGERWLTAIIQKSWDVAWDLWDHRNNVVHKKDDGVLRQQLQHDIRAQVNLGSSTLTAQARPLLRQRLAVLLTARTEVQKAWLLRVVNARARFLRRHTEVSGGYHRERILMRRFLRRATIRNGY